jgi:hypothetical protein
MGIPKIDRAEVDRLAQEWCKAKHIVVMIDDVGRQFALDVANSVLRDFVHTIAAKVAVERSVDQPEVPVQATSKNSIVLTDF